MNQPPDNYITDYNHWKFVTIPVRERDMLQVSPRCEILTVVWNDPWHMVTVKVPASAEWTECVSMRSYEEPGGDSYVFDVGAVDQISGFKTIDKFGKSQNDYE